MPKSFLLGVLTLLSVVAVACNGAALTPLPEPSPDADVATTPAATPDLPATVAAEVEATIAALSTPTPAPTEAPTPVPATVPAQSPTPTPEPQVAPTATPLSPAVVEITTPILPAAVAAVQLAPESVSLEEGETRQLESVVEDGAGNRLAGRSVAWSSSNSAVAQVSGTGQVTGVSAGAASVTASVEGVGAMATIEVGHGPVASVEIALGSGDQLVAILRDAASHRLQDRTVTWSSSDPGVVDVEAQTGRLTVGAVGIGVATVTAAAEGVIATFSVTANPCYGVTMSPKHGENSDVLLLGSVAVAVIWSPRESAIARAMAKLTSPLLSVVTVANPRKYSPSPNPEGSNSEFEQNWIVNVLGLPWTPVTELLTTEVTTWKFCKLMDLRLLQIQL